MNLRNSLAGSNKFTDSINQCRRNKRRSSFKLLPNVLPFYAKSFVVTLIIVFQRTTKFIFMVCSIAALKQDGWLHRNVTRPYTVLFRASASRYDHYLKLKSF